MPGRRARRVMAPDGAKQCLAATAQHRRSTHRKGTVRHVRGSARTGACHRRPREPRARETAPAGKHPGVAAHQVVVRSVVRDRAARSVPKAGGPDVGRHAAAAACDGEGIRVDGQYRTCAGSGCLGSKATGRPLELSSFRTCPRPQSRPRGAADAAMPHRLRTRRRLAQALRQRLPRGRLAFR